MKKHLITNFVFASMLTASSLALAGQPSENAAEGRANAEQGKDNAKRPSPTAGEHSSNGGGNGGANAGGNPKIPIAHCGCNYDDSGLEWKHIRVSTKARGHLRHTADSEASCINEMDEEVFFTRGFDDCRISDEPSNNLGGLEQCDEDLDDGVDTLPVVGDSCEPVEEPIVEPVEA